MKTYKFVLNEKEIKRFPILKMKTQLKQIYDIDKILKHRFKASNKRLEARAEYELFKFKVSSLDNKYFKLVEWNMNYLSLK